MKNYNLSEVLRMSIPDRKPTDKSISFSQYSMYSQCPLRWKLCYIDRIRVSKPSMLLTFGTALHEVLQMYIHSIYVNSVKEADQLNLDQILQDRLVELYSIQVAENNDEHYSTSEEIQEFYADGVEILNWIRRNRSDYFEKRDWELLGIELPLYHPVSGYSENIMLNGFLDVVLYNSKTNTVRIIDIKTSMRGWNDNDKKNTSKTAQLIIYKEYFAKQFGYNVDTIEIEYFIVKRKLYNESMFPQKRVQLFAPASGRITRKKITESVNEFVSNCFNTDGSYKTDTSYPATTNKGKSCRYCEFKDKFDLCPKENRLK